MSLAGDQVVIQASAHMFKPISKGSRANWSTEHDYRFVKVLSEHTLCDNENGLTFSSKYADSDIVDYITQALEDNTPLASIAQDLATQYPNKVAEHRSEECIELLVQLKCAIPEFSYEQINNKHINMWTRVIVPFREVFNSGGFYKSKSMFHKDCKRFTKALMELISAVHSCGIDGVSPRLYKKPSRGNKLLEQWLTAMLSTHRQKMVEFLVSCSAKLAFTYIRSKNADMQSANDREFLEADTHTPRTILTVLKQYMEAIVKQEQLESSSDPAVIKQLIDERDGKPDQQFMRDGERNVVEAAKVEPIKIKNEGALASKKLDELRLKSQNQNKGRPLGQMADVVASRHHPYSRPLQQYGARMAPEQPAHASMYGGQDRYRYGQTTQYYPEYAPQQSMPHYPPAYPGAQGWQPGYSMQPASPYYHPRPQAVATNRHAYYEDEPGYYGRRMAAECSPQHRMAGPGAQYPMHYGPEPHGPSVPHTLLYGQTTMAVAPSRMAPADQQPRGKVVRLLPRGNSLGTAHMARPAQAQLVHERNWPERMVQRKPMSSGRWPQEHRPMAVQHEAASLPTSPMNRMSAESVMQARGNNRVDYNHGEPQRAHPASLASLLGPSE